MNEENNLQTANVETNQYVRFAQIAGAACMILGAIVLLLQGLGNVSAAERFFMLTGILAVTATGGVYLAANRGERSSGRMLIAIFLILIPAFYMQLGALVYSTVHLPTIGLGSAIPAVFAMNAVSSFGLWASVLLGCTVIAPLCFLSVKIFIPGAYKDYGILLTALGAIACLPIRNGAFVDVILIATAVNILIYDRYYLATIAYARTKETLIARVVIQSFPILLASRAAFYGHSLTTWIVAFVVLSCLSTLLSKDESERSGSLFSDGSIALALLCVPGYVRGLVSSDAIFVAQYTLPSLYLVAKGIIANKKEEKRIIVGATILAIGSIITNHSSVFGENLVMLLVDATVLVIPLFVFALGIARRSQYIVGLALLSLCVSLERIVPAVWTQLSGYGWVVLMLMGLALLFGAPYLSSLQKKVKIYWSRAEA